MNKVISNLLYETFVVICCLTGFANLAAGVYFLVLFVSFDDLWLKGFASLVILVVALSISSSEVHPSEKAPYYGNHGAWGRDNPDENDQLVIVSSICLMIADAIIYFLVF